MIDLRIGDCRQILPTLPADSIHCCVTSPPYWGMRQYLFDEAVVLRYDLSDEQAARVEAELARRGISPRQGGSAEPCVLAGCRPGGVVLDPFAGSGTVGRVAEDNGRNSLLIELSAQYGAIARRKTAQCGLVADKAIRE